MNTRTSLTLTTTQVLIGSVIAVSALFAVAVPSQAHAATYAFVNNSGEVSIVSANSPTEALANAFNISVHSGVMLLQSQLNALVGFHVSL